MRPAEVVHRVALLVVDVDLCLRLLALVAGRELGDHVLTLEVRPRRVRDAVQDARAELDLALLVELEHAGHGTADRHRLLG